MKEGQRDRYTDRQSDRQRERQTDKNGNVKESFVDFAYPKQTKKITTKRKLFKFEKKLKRIG